MAAWGKGGDLSNVHSFSRLILAAFAQAPYGSLAIAAVVVSQLASGCSRSQAIPTYNPVAAAREALAAFDTNANGTLETSEAAASPSLTTAFTRIDSDQDGAISSAEIAARIQGYQAAQIGLMPFHCTVTVAGMPLQNGTVTLVPETFLAGAVKPAVGTTSIDGIAAPIVEGEQFPAVACGLYRVEVSWQKDGREALPAQFNVNSTLGIEVAPDVPNLERGVHFELKSP